MTDPNPTPGPAARARDAARAVPLIGPAVRYVKRVVLLPWNFHKFYQWWAGSADASAQKVAAAVAGFEGRLDAKLTAVSEVLGGPLAELAVELRRLNECHAGAYDLVVEQLRDQAAALRALADGRVPAGDQAARLRELSDAQAALAKRVEDLARQVQSAAGRVLSHTSAA